MSQSLQEWHSIIVFLLQKKKWKLHSHPWKHGTEIFDILLSHFLEKLLPRMYLPILPVAMVQALSRHGPQGWKLWSCCILNRQEWHGQCNFWLENGWVSHHRNHTTNSRTEIKQTRVRTAQGNTATFQAGLLWTSHAYKAKLVFLDRILEQ